MLGMLASCGGGTCQTSPAHGPAITLSMPLPPANRPPAQPGALALPLAPRSNGSLGPSPPVTPWFVYPATSITTYTPAQIRAAYGMPAVSASWSSLTPRQAAELGAGETIYLIDGDNDSMIVRELQQFNSLHNLPTCVTLSIAPGTPLPLAPADPSVGCTLSVVYVSPSGAITTNLPQLEPVNVVEIQTDVEWAHVAAPLARLILLEMPAWTWMGPALTLAGTMGPGIVSMSYTSPQTTREVTSYYDNPTMSFLAATGDFGGPVTPWPAMAPNVLAVGGTSLRSAVPGARVESAWIGGGSGISSYTPQPPYQLPLTGQSMRSVADVSFDADPYTGQYMLVWPPGGSWYQESIGGTSIATPEWAGILADVDAVRALQGKGVVGVVANMLYASLTDGSYSSILLDVSSGRDGTCSNCFATVGYDQPTGLGTPQFPQLLAYLSAGVSATAPVVGAVAVKAATNKPLSLTMAVSSADPVAWALSGQPPGMLIDPASGNITWASPVAGNYTVQVSAIDTVNGLSGSATATLELIAAQAPVVTAAAVSAKSGVPWQYTVRASSTALDTLQFALAGAPPGMSIDATGRMNWSAPVPGSYPVVVTATSSLSGLSGSATIRVQVAPAATTPVLTVMTPKGSQGTALSAILASLSDPGASSATLSIQGQAPGMSLRVVGQSVVLDWAHPVCGSYTLRIRVVDSSGSSVSRVAYVSIGLP